MDLVTTIPVITTPATAIQAPPTTETAPVTAVPPARPNIEEPKDSVELNQTQPKAEPLKISRWRLFFDRLTQNQIEEINTTKMLPENAKFEFGGKSLANNWCNYTGGTRKLLPGYELKNSIWGFTSVVPEGTKGFWYKKTAEEKAEKV